MTDPTPALTDPTPALAGLNDDQKIAVLLAVHGKHSAELLAIEESQQKLIVLVLGIYSAGVTAVLAIFKDNEDMLEWPSPAAIALVLVAVLIAAYGLFMGFSRNNARQRVREALVRVDHALLFFKPGAYLAHVPLLPDDFKTFAKKSFLDWAHVIVILAAVLFIGTVLVLGFDP